MFMRVFLLLLVGALAPIAVAEPPPILGLVDGEVCASRGASDDPSDIDASSCRPFRGFGDLDSQGRIIWVRGRVAVPEDYPGPNPLGLYTGALASRELWWNGERIGAAGRVGNSRETETPGDLDAVSWIPPHLIRAGDNAVAIRYSTFSLAMPVRTPLHYVYVGRMGYNRGLLISYGPPLAAAGALIAAAIFFGFAFLTNRRSLSPLFIALMSLCAVGQLWLESIRGFVGFPYPMQIWRLTGVAAFALTFALSLAAYVAIRFTPEHWRIRVAAAALVALGLAFFFPGFDGKTLAFIMGPSVVSLAAAAWGVARKRPGAIAATLGLVVFVVLQIVENAGFLDRTFYIAVSLLMLVLFVDQVRALRRAREAEEQARRRAAMLELELLRRRIAPHFLMNTLNALAGWVESDPRTGVKMIEALAEEFRILSQISDRALIPLSEEIALCRRHLEVMSYRVDRPFSLAVRNVDEAAEVPPGVLHTLVENAFTHGRFADGGEFVLTSERDAGGERLVLLAPPAEAPAPESSKTSGGEGLSYVRRRLEAAFGAGARVESGASAKGWRTVLTIPRTDVAIAT